MSLLKNVSARWIRWVVLSLSLGCASLALAAEQSGPRKIGSAAEWLPAREILVHTPGEELFLGVLHPAAALFERVFSLAGAQREHLKYLDVLRAAGVKVHALNDLLLEGTLDARGERLENDATQGLRKLAAAALSYDSSALSPELKAEQIKVHQATLLGLHPRELLRTILHRPKIHLRSTGKLNTGLAARYELEPLMNLYFMRDPLITTALGVVVGNLNSPQRKFEVDVVRFALQKQRIQPIFEVSGEGRLEGGDFLPAGDVAFLGQGLRTNAQAVRMLLEKKVFGTKTVAIVKDPWQNQIQMHLDTYFNLISLKLAVLEASRAEVQARRPTVDVYELREDRYQKVRGDVDFRGYLEKTLGFKVLLVSKEDQARYGVNFLTLASQKLVGVDGVSETYKKQLREQGVETQWLDFRNLTGGYGAAHCMTQVLSRQ